jgi:aspartyl-tRNA(Asn)/glutamyl-tRNA(Gln) amidotransferase subunit C
MITTDDITHLADLARIKLEPAEIETLTHEIDSILGYVGQIKDVTGDMERVVPALHNVMREDVVTHEPRQYTEAILRNAPAREKDFLKVKKILGNSDDAM